MSWDLYVVTDAPSSRGRSHEEAVEKALMGGAGVIQLRAKELPARELFELGKRLKAIVQRWGGIFIVNDRLDVALALDADGVHLGQDDLPLGVARSLLGTRRVIGISVAGPRQAVDAEFGGATYVAASAVFATATKGDAPAIGLEGLREIARAVSIPVIAIGGIDRDRAASVIKAGAVGIAVVSAVVGAPDITAAARELAGIVRRARNEGGNHQAQDCLGGGRTIGPSPGSPGR